MKMLNGFLLGIEATLVVAQLVFAGIWLWTQEQKYEPVVVLLGTVCISLELFRRVLKLDRPERGPTEVQYSRIEIKKRDLTATIEILKRTSWLVPIGLTVAFELMRLLER